MIFISRYESNSNTNEWNVYVFKKFLQANFTVAFLVIFPEWHLQTSLKAVM